MNRQSMFAQVIAATVLYAAVIWYSMPPEDRRYLALQALQAYRGFMWRRWLSRTPAWLVEAWQVRGKVPIE